MPIFNENIHVNGTLSATKWSAPADAFGDTQVNSASPITAAKLQHQNQIVFGQMGTVIDEVRVVYVAFAAGTLIQFQAGSAEIAVGDSTVEFDLLKNGVTVLSLLPELDNTLGTFDSVVAGITTTAYAAGDVFEVVVTTTAGTGTLPVGVFAAITVREAGQ